VISTHVMDAARGVPAVRVPVQLDSFISGHGWHEIGRAETNLEGRAGSFGEPDAPGVYRLMYDVAAYAPEAFFPTIAITFEVRDPNERYHIPLILSPFGYSAHRES
jgi:5-hydroxyisourate hydrolase